MRSMHTPALLLALSGLVLATGCPDDVSIVAVTTPPTAEISSPGSNAQTFATGDTISFEGVVKDQQDAPDRLTASWLSDIDGLLDEAVPDSTGRVTHATIDLSHGTHLVTLQAVDSDGEVGEDHVTVIVTRENVAPTVTIDYPVTGDSFVEGANITFTAVADDEDEEDEPQDLLVEWASGTDGFLGNDAPDSSGLLSLSTANLTLGSHIVSVTVTDPMGATATDQVYLEVVEENEAPQVMITNPGSGDSVLESSVQLEGQATDDVDRPDFLAITWESDLDGVFNWDTASSAGDVLVNTSGLSQGTHTITLSAEDTGGLSASDSIQLSVVGIDDWDSDGDGWTPTEGDCDDADASVSPGATEACDLIDNDCDGDINEDLGDGYEPNDSSATDLGSMDGDGYCLYYMGYISGSADIQTVSGTVHSPDDVDVFSFDTDDDYFDCLDESGYGIQISLTSIASGHDYALELYYVDGGDTLVASSDASGNASEYVDYTGTYGFDSDTDDGGVYEVVVSPTTGSDYGCSDSYQLEIVVW